MRYMISIRQLYLDHVGQTSEMPLALEIDHAQGVYIYSTGGKRYIDMNSGISVSSLGHCHPAVVAAIQDQSEKYLHTMVYGEHIQSAQVQMAQLLTTQLDVSLNSLYYLMSGTEATELAMKLVKKHTSRYEIVACRDVYHGSTQGAESLRSDEAYLANYRPLLPGIRHIDFNNVEDIDSITSATAGVIVEVVQGEVGVRAAEQEWLIALRKRCDEVEAILVFDEIQSGFGRTGTLFAHQRYGVVPDVLLVGKAMGGGMPIAGVIADRELMSTLVKNPALGHITTFGGHPVSCAAAHASLQFLLESDLIAEVKTKSDFIKEQLSTHPIIKEVRGEGFMMAVEPKSRKYLKHIVGHAHELGVLVDWFLFNDRSFRIAPPLIITQEQLEEACALLMKAFDYAYSIYAK